MFMIQMRDRVDQKSSFNVKEGEDKDTPSPHQKKASLHIVKFTTVDTELS